MRPTLIFTYNVANRNEIRQMSMDKYLFMEYFCLIITRCSAIGNDFRACKSVIFTIDKSTSPGLHM